LSDDSTRLRTSTYTAAHTQALLEHFNWELLDCPPYSPHLAPSKYHLFIYLKNWVRSQCFNNNEELMEVVKMWLSLQLADFFDIGIQKLIPQYH
jgi:transposase